MILHSDGPESLLSKHEINDPTTPNMLTLFSAMLEDVGVVAPCIFQRVGQSDTR
jgi:hypothetical protein